MTGILYRIASVAVARPGRILLGWLVALLALGALAVLAGGTLRDTMTAPDSSSGRAMETLRVEFPEASGASGHVVGRWLGGADDGAVAALAERVAAVDGVRGVDVRISPDGAAALVTASFAEEVPDVDLAAATEALTTAAEPMAGAGATVAVGGQVPEAIQGPNGTAEGVGLAVAVAALVVAFGSVLVAGVPLLVAALGLGAGISLIMLLAAVTDVSTVSPTLGMMMGLGVGIDYALFIVARHRESLAAGMAPREAAVHATATAGRSVVVAGVVVLVAIGGLLFAGVPGFATMGFAAGLVVLACVAAAVTAVPALLSLLGTRAGRHRWHRPATFESRWASRIAVAIGRRPAAWLVAAVVVLLALASPALGMRLGQNDAGAERADAPTRVAFDLVADAFGPGTNGPLAVVAPASGVDDVLAALRADAGVASTAPPVVSESGTTVLVSVVPTTGPSDEATFDLVARLHDALPAGAEITGATAAMVDTTGVLGDHLWQVVLAVLLATFVLLVPLMRSLVVPLKAVVANLLSVGAAYGVMTLAFQTSAGAALIGLPGPVPIPGWAPVVLFGILFGLSMDYEIFMVSRVREHYGRTGDPVSSVVDGLGAAASVIALAGAIMVSVAFGFALDPGVMVKIIGVGMAAAILVDVTVVRLVLVPAALLLMGRANWYLPRLGGRIVPAPTAAPEDVSIR